MLGGTYLVIFYLGMLFGSMDFRFAKVKNEFLSTIASFICVAGWHEFMYKNLLKIDSYLPFGVGVNPPGISFCIYGILMVWFLYSLFSLMKDCNNKIVHMIESSINFLGKYSLYIFLYHRLILDYYLIHLPINNMIIKRLVYFGAMILIPVMGKVVFDYLKDKVRKFGSISDNNTIKYME